MFDYYCVIALARHIDYISITYIYVVVVVGPKHFFFQT